MKRRVRQIGLESPVSFADILESSQRKSLQMHPISDFRSDATDTPSNEILTTEDHDQDNENQQLELEHVEMDDEDDNEEDDHSEEEDNIKNQLSITTTKNLLQVSDIDSTLLDRTMEAFCLNLKNSVNEQFLSSRERLFRQTENEINSITKIYQDTLNDKESELNSLKSDYGEMNDKYNKLNVDYHKLETSNNETKKKLNCIRQLSQTVMKWKNDCEKKRFVTNFIDKKVIPNKKRVLLQNIYYFWKMKALQIHYQRYDEIWEKRLETVSKTIIQKYEMNINKLRDELLIRNDELNQLRNQRKEQQENMKRAFMRGVSALNLEAMSLFNTQKRVKSMIAQEEDEENQPRSQIPSQQM
eukprot:CAMPEP_0201564606 /NCGR_PEP_ID=MMETSP0190_2-20130828/3050_1 /ASSEMBLY_ACC=CAM_ASM_000263 /TAXON_ID=37353 /ORGANISM="Rosalina sp." /LENGTH=356 /DNA_ID=CAMNT_0047981007 /DNA_START=30 /DNA_END=1100 /DNA_ORIENTATION=+